MQQRPKGSGPMVNLTISKVLTITSSKMLVQQTFVANMLSRVLFLSLPNLSNQMMPKRNGGPMMTLAKAVAMETL